MKLFRLLALALTIACGASAATTTSDETTPPPRAEPTPPPAPEPEPEPEPEPAEPAAPPIVMDAVPTGEVVALGCGRFQMALPEGGRVASQSCELPGDNHGSGWVGGKGTARLIVGDCDLYLTLAEEVPLPLLAADADGFTIAQREGTQPHPAGAFLAVDGRDGHLYRRSSGGTRLSLEVGADRDNCIPTMTQTLVAAAQTVSTPGLRPEEGASVLPMTAAGHTVEITVPDGYLVEFTGSSRNEYETGWRMRPVGSPTGVRLFGYPPGEPYEPQGEEVLRGRALGALRTFTLSGGDFVDAENRGIATARSSDRHAEILISIDDDDTPVRQVVLEALASSRFGRTSRR